MKGGYTDTVFTTVSRIGWHFFGSSPIFKFKSENLYKHAQCVLCEALKWFGWQTLMAHASNWNSTQWASNILLKLVWIIVLAGTESNSTRPVYFNYLCYVQGTLFEPTVQKLYILKPWKWFVCHLRLTNNVFKIWLLKLHYRKKRQAF